MTSTVKKAGVATLGLVLMSVLASMFVLSSAEAKDPKDIANPTQPVAAGYVKFEGIDGESTDKDHKDWIDLLSVSQSIHRPDGATGSSRRRGSAILEDIVVSKEIDKSSPKLAEAVLQGRVIPKVEIHLTKNTNGGQVVYYQYELKNVLVTSYNVSGETGGSSQDDFALNFEEIKVTYTETDSKGKKKGNVEYTWKVEEGEA